MEHIPIIKTVSGFRHCLDTLGSRVPAPIPPANLSSQLGKLGLVPTMGALHSGHLSLIERARQENEKLVVSIFVNPLQFSAAEDFKTYPQPLERDVQLCQDLGVDVVFAPSVEVILPESVITQVVPPPHLTERLCGQSRRGHFTGVATIVMKLLQIVQPDRAYFGEKDAQQLCILRRLAQDLNLPVQIVPGKTVRESTGLAYSSRNQYLTPDQRQQAALLYQSLLAARQLFQAGECDRTPLLAKVEQILAQEPQIQLEYVDLVDPVTLQPLNEIQQQGLLAIAAQIGKARLIDNISLDRRRPIVAIDGPAGAGKSTVTRRCAQALGLQYLDTGAMYRAVTWLVLEQGIDLHDSLAIADLVEQCVIDLQADPDPQQPPQVWVNQQEVTQVIRSPRVTAQVSTIAAQAAVRTALLKQQQRFGEQGGVIAEGRDIGTHVFPEAGLKIFLTASIVERARRRQQELATDQVPEVTLTELIETIATRDQKDSERALAPLRKAYDAIEINTDGLSIEQVIDQIMAIYQDRFCTPAH
ncbi:MAG: bifunctional pantoate--beta-alanine ligase/(d)CMP kinase [Acaryochloridaceae cyanobacterium SU_2_1]|nr:bifunctional pantoate--beta-alanine ligase/(d)CMP kinase [Acaryochloridaceae cyanobacterium SU_2_1]NJM95609.1 bifunctional pantoate--beta-alanine ligase/(d)CMP kinase [Acaryochloridaceae cyanobacterium CSU_5_19]